MALVVPTGVTGWSGFWNYGPQGAAASGYAPKYARSHHERRIARMVGMRGFRKYRAQMRALHNGTVGSAATDSYSRVQAVQAMNDAALLGGKRSLQVVNNNTTTTAAMLTAINARIYDPEYTNQSYPTELSGNSGGGRLGK